MLGGWMYDDALPAPAARGIHCICIKFLVLQDLLLHSKIHPHTP